LNRTADDLAFIESTWSEILMVVDPPFGLRLRILNLLVAESRGEQRPQLWRWLANACARTTADKRNAGAADPYDLSLASPFFHLPTDTEDELVTALDMIERYRISGLEYWFNVTRPPLPEDPAVQELLAQEEALLTEFRGARLVRLLPKLPRHYQRHMRDLDELETIGDSLSQDRAIARLYELPRAMWHVWDSLEESVPDYAQVRRNPVTSVEAFVAA
jgi:hypothetical protein